jgi:hypothetical protein
MNDYETLLRAAQILERTSRHPRSFVLAVVCHMLRIQAGRLAARSE